METIINEAQYAQGFEDAYWIAKTEPSIAEELRQEEINPSNDYNLGFKEGLEHHLTMSLTEEFNKLRNQSLEQDLEYDR